VLLPIEGEAERRIFEAVVKPERFAGQPAALEDERARLRGEIARSEAMLDNSSFVQKAPAKLVDAEQAKLARYRAELAALEQ
jgi:valyl-tRNA synthetase